MSRLRHEVAEGPAGVALTLDEEEYFKRVSDLFPLSTTREFSLRSGPYARLAALPRVRLATTPTPLQRAERLSKALGGPDIWFKRDDLTGFALGGNKARKLELIAADALRTGADTLGDGRQKRAIEPRAHDHGRRPAPWSQPGRRGAPRRREGSQGKSASR